MLPQRGIITYPNKLINQVSNLEQFAINDRT